jgi:hypothetical protein
MRSEKQIQASRANGARSRGPVTAQGKRNSSRNNLRHGFSIHDPSLDRNPPAGFTNLKAQYMADFQPATAQEIHLVHTMAVARWRTFLVQEAERRALDKALAHQKANSGGPMIPPTIPMMRGVFVFEDVPECRPLLRYQVTFHLQFQRALRRLTALVHSRSQSNTASGIEKNPLAVRTQQEPESKGSALEPKPAARVELTPNLGSCRVPAASTNPPTPALRKAAIATGREIRLEPV